MVRHLSNANTWKIGLRAYGSNLTGVAERREKGKDAICWLLGHSLRAATDKIGELKGEIVQWKKENEDEENGWNTWELKFRQLEMQTKLL